MNSTELIICPHTEKQCTVGDYCEKYKQDIEGQSESKSHTIRTINNLPEEISGVLGSYCVEVNKLSLIDLIESSDEHDITILANFYLSQLVFSQEFISEVHA